MEKFMFWMVLTGVMAMQCSDDSARIYTLNDPFELKEGQMVTLTWGEEESYIDIQILSIEDSRCPADVTCVRFGEAEVKAALNGLEEKLTTIDLCIGDCPQRNQGAIMSDTIQVEIDNRDYAVILKDVLPYPTTTNQNVTKKAVLKVISR